MRIKSIEAMDKRRAVVSFEDGSYFPLYKGELKKYSLAEDAEVSEEEYRTVLSECVLQRAKERALHLLESADRTEKQLRDKLAAGKYPPDVIENTMAFLRKYAYIDDYDYALSYIRGHAERSSLRVIKSKLLTKGIGRDMAEEALLEYLKENDGYDPKKLILDIVRKKHFNYENADIKERSRMVSHLMRKGFQYDDILEGIRKG